MPRVLRKNLGWGAVAAVFLLVLVIIVHSGGHHDASVSTSTADRPATETVRKLFKPPPKPAKPKPKKAGHKKTRRSVLPVRTTTVVETLPAPPPQTRTVTVTRAIQVPPKTVVTQKPKPKPKPKPRPAKPRVIARFVWVMANVSSAAQQSPAVRLREYDGKDVVKLATLRSGRVYRYYYKHKADQLCQVIKPGTTATSPVCVRIMGGTQVITFTSNQV